MGAGEERRPLGGDSNPRDEEMIRRLQAGGDDPLEAVRGLEGDVDSSELAELENVLGMLAAAGKVERQTVRASMKAAEDSTVLSGAEVAALSRQVTGTPVRFTARGWATAAALLTLALAAGRFTGSENGDAGLLQDPGPTLGAGIEAIRPVAGGTFDQFEWTGTLMIGGWYQVRVLDRDAASHQEIALSEDLFEPSWTPALTESWPDTITWEVIVYDGDGVPVDTASFEVSRLPH